MQACCQMVGHDCYQIQGLCLNQECKRYICNKCLQKGSHNDHFDQIFFMQVSDKKDLDNLIKYISEIQRQISKFFKEQYDFYQMIRQQNLESIQFFNGVADQKYNTTQSQICENLIQLKQLKELKIFQKTRFKLKQFYEFFEDQLKFKIEQYRQIQNTPKIEKESPFIQNELPIRPKKTPLPKEQQRLR
ncbi:hypothetical protein pb186bvf_001394 [Paramecium bursaria]